MTEVLRDLNLWQVLSSLVAVPLAGAFLCRLTHGEGPIWATVRARYILMYFAGFCYCGTVIFLQPQGAEVLGEAMGLAMCALLLWTTYPTWADGPPEYALRRVRAEDRYLFIDF